MIRFINSAALSTCVLGLASAAQAITTGTIGDVDHDGRVTNIDSMRLYRELQQPIGTACDAARADVNNDGVVDTGDSTMIAQFVTGEIPELCDDIDNDGNGTIDDGCVDVSNSYSYWIPTSETQLPSGYLDMEVESKFEVRLDQMKTLHDHLDSLAIPSSDLFGYQVSRRWGGRTKLFRDYYYDAGNENPPSAISRGWVARHRTRLASNSAPSAWDPSAFLSFQFTTVEEDLIQVKDSPIRYGEVWFRNEWGNSCVFVGSASDPRCGGELDAQGLLRTGTAEDWMYHPATNHLLFDLQSYGPYSPDLFLQTYRQRWLLTEPGQADETFEISLDFISEWNWRCDTEGPSWCRYDLAFRGEFEIEIVAPTRTFEHVQELFELGDLLQHETGIAFAIRGPSTNSKGAVDVDDSTPLN